MELYALLAKIVERPEAVKAYRDLQLLYDRTGKSEEAAAIAHLIEKKFVKTNDADHATNAGA